MPNAPKWPCWVRTCPKLRPCPVHGERAPVKRSAAFYRTRRERDTCRSLYNRAAWRSGSRAFLEAAGIRAAERGESLRHTHGLTLDGIGAVQILVAEVDEDRARSLLDSAEAGMFRLAEDAENPSNDDSAVPPNDPKA